MLRRTTLLLVVITAVLNAVALAAQADDDAGALFKRVRDAAPAAAFTAKATLSSDRGWTRDLELSHMHLNDGTDASYMEVTAPMDLKDTRFLVFDHAHGRDEQFIYVPAAKRAIQVGPQTRKQEFLGSEWAVGDLVQPDFDMFTYSFVGEEDVAGRHCKLIEAVPKNAAEELYSKSIFSVDPADLVVLKSQFFDAKGKLWKVWTIDKLEKIDGIWTPRQQKMTNVLENHWSRLDLEEVKYNVQLPDETFHKSHLIR